MKRNRGALGRAINYRFNDPDLLERALTHRSAGAPNYERLEFLGDSLVNFLVADALYRRQPEASEGDLTRLRASLVKESTLASIAAGLRLGELLLLGPGEQTSGGFRRKSILADALEGLLGAVYLDGGIEAARQVADELFAERLDSLPDPETLKDPKTRLQEWLQGRGQALPEYALEETRGAEHARTFFVSCKIADPPCEARASGSSRRKAEQAAAAKVLAALDHA